MKVTYNKELMKYPIKSWCNSLNAELTSELDYMTNPIKIKDRRDNVATQFMNLVNHPKIGTWVVPLPDAHYGYGMPIGAVAGFENTIIPHAVGKDIGCGVCFLRTNIPSELMYYTPVGKDKTILEIILDILIKNIPVGFSRHKNHQSWHGFDDSKMNIFPDILFDGMFESALYSLGTLGGGNHFIEIQKTFETNEITFMLHSGSRGPGAMICDYYNDIAKELNHKWSSNILDNQGLNFLPVDSIEGNTYIQCMRWAMRYAEENRYRMMRQIENVTINILKKFNLIDKYENLQENDVAHNYASFENVNGKNLWVHRKGATRARKDDVICIPGSMGTPSFIGRGLGNEHSLNSCSHGAGRDESRTVSRERISQDAYKNSMNGILVKTPGGKIDMSEAPDAYKDVQMIIDEQKDLIEIEHICTPIGVIKEGKR